MGAHGSVSNRPSPPRGCRHPSSHTREPSALAFFSFLPYIPYIVGLTGPLLNLLHISLRQGHSPHTPHPTTLPHTPTPNPVPRTSYTLRYDACCVALTGIMMSTEGIKVFLHRWFLHLKVFLHERSEHANYLSSYSRTTMGAQRHHLPYPYQYLPSGVKSNQTREQPESADLPKVFIP